MPTILEPERVFPVTPARSATPLAPLNQYAQQWRQSVAEKEEVSNRLVALTTTASMAAGIRRIMPSSIGSADAPSICLQESRFFTKNKFLCFSPSFSPFAVLLGFPPRELRALFY